MSMSSNMVPSSSGGTGKSTSGQPGNQLNSGLQAQQNQLTPNQSQLSGAQAGVPSWMQPQGRPQPFQTNMSAAHPLAQALAHPAVQQVLNHPVVQQALSQPHVQQAIQQATQQNAGMQQLNAGQAGLSAATQNLVPLGMGMNASSSPFQMGAGPAGAGTGMGGKSQSPMMGSTGGTGKGGTGTVV